MTNREVRVKGGNNCGKLELERISCLSQVNIAFTAGKNTNMRDFKQQQASRTPDVPYPLVSSILLLSLPPAVLLVHNSTIIIEHLVQTSLSISPCPDDKFRPSTAYTKCIIHHVKLPLSKASN